MANYKYSLANYSIDIQSNDPTINSILGRLRIGGEGSAIGQISVELDNDMWSTEAYPTGAWVHNKNLSRVGKVTIQMNQLSSYEAKLRQLYNIYYGGDYAGVTLTVYDNSTGSRNKVVSCVDCYLTKIPSLILQETAQQDDWIFTCGEVNFI